MTISLRLYGPSGGPGGNANYGTVYGNPPSPIVSILVNVGAWIDKLTVVRADGIADESSPDVPTSPQIDIIIPPGDHIKAINGTYGNYVNSISFILDSGTQAATGTDHADGWFEYVCDDDEEIIGFFGKAGQSLDSIGVFVADRRDVPSRG